MNHATITTTLALGAAVLIGSIGPAAACDREPAAAAPFTPSAVSIRTPLSTYEAAIAARPFDDQAAPLIARTRVVSSDDDAFSDGQGRSVEVRVENGKVSVRIDGKDVPSDRIVEKDGRVVVLDGSGNEIESIHIGVAGGQWKSGHHGPLGRTFGGDVDMTIDDGGNNAFVYSFGEQPKVMLGVRLDAPGPALEHHLKLDPGTTTMLTAVYPGLPADAAGLDRYDIVTKIDGRAPADPSTLRAALADREPGDVVRLQVIHKGHKKTFEIELAAFDAETLADQGEESPFSFRFGRQNWVPFDSTNLRDVFIDPDNRVFELAPRGSRGSIQLLPGGQSDDGAAGDAPDPLDGRLRRLDRRLAELEDMIDALLDRARDGDRK